MGRFAKLIGKEPQIIKIGEEEFTIKPLTGKHMGLLAMAGDDKENTIKYMVLASLQQTDATITLEDVEELPLMEFTTIMEAVANVNGI